MSSYGGGSFERILSLEDFYRHESVARGNGNVILVSTIAWTAILADSPVDPHKPNRVINRFINGLVHDYFGLVEDYSALAQRLMRSIDLASPGIITDYIDEMNDTPIAREYHHFVHTQSSLTLKYMLTFLLFGKKVHYDSEDLIDTAFRGWQEVENRLQDLRLPAFVENLRHIMTHVFAEWEPDFFLPRHGNGAVAEPGILGTVSKNGNLVADKVLDYCFRSDSMFLQNETTCSYFPKVSGKASLNRISRLKFVPKDHKKKRTICMEPVNLQYAQQGVRLWIEDMIERTWLLKHIVLKDQGVNRSYAQFGSLTGVVDTIDLSSASDSVSWDLVKTIFPPKVLKYLVATRSAHVRLPDGNVVPIRKYAPMGSALCFPIQSLIYTSVLLLVGIAMRLGESVETLGDLKGLDISRLYKLSFEDVLSSNETFKFQPFLAYGDDIICDKRMTSNVVSALGALGFKVNVDKSFTGSCGFRESCGGYYMLGVDVTPYTLKLKSIQQRISIDSLAGLIDQINELEKYGYTSARRHLIQFALFYPIRGVDKVKSTGKNPILFTRESETSPSLSILSDKAHNLHLKSRVYDPMVPTDDSRFHFQRDEVKSICLKPRRYVDYPSEDDWYHHGVWWRSRYHSTEDAGMLSAAVKADTLGVRVGWRWTAAGR